MSRYSRKIDRVAAERLLRGEPADPRHPDDLLAVLLATAAAPAQVGELAGEEAAVAAFRRARAAYPSGCAARPGDVAATTAEQPWEPSRLRRLARHPVRLALVALTATTAGGVALAASSGPWSLRPSDEQRPAATPSSAPSQPAGPGSGQGQGGAGSAMPGQSLVALCRAYKAGVGTAPGKALDHPAFSSLVAAAGGKDKVPAYCADVLAADAKRAKKPKPSDPAATTPGQPNETGRSGHYAPTGRPTGRPTVLPTPTVDPSRKTSPQHTRTPGTRLLSAQIAGGRSAPPPWSPPAGPTFN